MSPRSPRLKVQLRESDGVLNVQGDFPDVGVAVEGVLAAGRSRAAVGGRERRGAGQVVTGQQRIEIRIRLKRAGAARRIRQ